MIAYVDASAILRIAFGEPGASWGPGPIDGVISSVLTEVECLRTLDRKHVLGLLPPADLAIRHATVRRLLTHVTLVELTRPILSHASQGTPTPLGTLEAIHLVTALAWRESHAQPIVMATHDAALALAARAHGLDVLGA